jgi:hypothetical protein
MKMMFAPVLEPGCSLHELRRSLNLAAACMNCVGLKLFAKNKKVFACYMD